MDGWLLLRGALIGLTISAPVGPVGLLVIRRTLAEGRVMGLVTGMGAATADGLYGCVGAFGLTLISSALTGGQFWLRLVGGLFLCYLGVTTFRARPAEQAAQAGGGTLLRAYGSTLLLTLTNPLTIFSFTLLLSGLGAARGDYGGTALLVLGVFCGSACWWLLLSGAVGLLRARVTPANLRWINWIAGTLVGLFGVAALLSLVVA